ncbi:hypothetical protein QSH18_21685 [Xanthomonas sp. NCPPB 2654]|nr:MULTISPECIES: hypothetical protein [unclassified Xanthomonas]MDL5368227.1 hypothetical protein [Xanthomonas sp. NCPPB 2654]MDR6675804.1 hypothetical protein [Xanthomonas translucens]UYC19359.1 hypothetical protein NUG20_14365 [Xanthomonas sp. CFBP 8443]
MPPLDAATAGLPSGLLSFDRRSVPIPGGCDKRFFPFQAIVFERDV